MSNPEYCRRDPEFLKSVFSTIADYASKYISEHYTYEQKVINFVPPEKLKEIINFSLPEEGCKIEENLKGLDKVLEQVMEYSVRTGSPRYFNQLWSGTDVACIIAEWISAFTNSSTYTYEVAPVYSLMEMEVVNHMLKIIGFNEDGSGDGILCPGGAVGNLMGMLMARQHKFPETKTEGNASKKLICFASVHSHYSVKRAAWIMGVGRDNCRLVPVNKDGTMDTVRLEQMIVEAKKEGGDPFFVSATSGTTVLGVFDNLEEVSAICAKHNVWFHVDGALGACAVLSPKYKHLVKGINTADSVTWSLHKMLGMNQQCAIVLTRYPGLLKITNASHADYLFHSDDTKPYDLGDKTLNCGRRQDSFKIWLSWKVHGDEGFRKRVDTCLSNAQYMAEQIKKRSEAFELLFEPAFTNVSFYYIPKCMRGQPASVSRREILGKYVPILRRRIQQNGTFLVNYNPLHASAPDFDFLPNFWRYVFVNPEQTKEDIDFVLDEMDRLGADLTLEN